MRGIHQFVPMLHRHDAVGEHSRALRDSLHASGVPSVIYTEIPDPATMDETRHYLKYGSEAEAGDVLVYQFATDSEMAGWLAARPETIVVNYHGITPPEYFAPWNNAITRLQVGAQQRLADLAPRVALGIADSEFISTELRQAGCTNIAVVPVAGIPAPAEPSPEALDRVRSRRKGAGAAWLSVGRWAPNKAHHQTLAALFVARATADPGATLTLVGSPTEPAYAAALRRYAAVLGLADAVSFVSHVDDDELAAHYRAADVLVMLSDHEGFGVPLVEAMGHDLPVVAFDAGAVGEVLGGAGILLDEKHPRRVAAAIARLMAEPAERERLVVVGRDRLRAIGLDQSGKRLVEALLAARTARDQGRIQP
ncbi:MAG TPA: glycosyltransferase family 4 protein [Acidimicrobiales bacterium]